MVELFRALAFAVLALVSSSVHAAGAVDSIPAGFEYGNNTIGFHPSAAVACVVLADYYNALPGSTLVLTVKSNTETACTFSRKQKSNGVAVGDTTETIVKRAKPVSCPANATLAGTSCTCNDGFSPDPTHKSCVPGCEAQKTVSSGYFDIGDKASALPRILGCKGGCEVIFDGTSPAGSALVAAEKHYFAKGEYITTGNKCTTGVDPGNGSPTPPKDTCPEGQKSGTINNKTVCFTPGNDPSTPDTPTPTTKPGDTTTTTGNSSGPKTNPDGSTTTTDTTTTTGPGGETTTTTTTTTTKPDGTTETKTDTVKTPGVDDPKAGEEDPGDDEETPCEKTPAMAGCGGTPGSTSGLYSKGSRTLGGVLAGHRDVLMSTPFGTAAGSFFNVAGGGSCPVFSDQIPVLRITLRIDQLCSPMAANIFAALKVCLLIVASFFAWRIAVE